MSAIRAYNPRPSSLPPPSPGSVAGPRAAAAAAPMSAYSPRAGRQLSEAARKSAQLVLELLAALPAPLPSTLPPTFLPTPAASPAKSAASASSASSSTASPSSTSFASFARKRAASTSPTAAGAASIGLGLGLPSPHKRARLSSPTPASSSALTPGAGTVPLPSGGSGSGHGPSPAAAPRASKGPSTSPEARFHTPDLARSHSSPSLPTKRELGRSSLRHEVGRADGAASGSGGAGKETWTREQWAAHAATIRDRALVLKRHGDAHQRVPNAKPHLVAALPADALRGLLCLTDSAMLYTYARWADEHARGRPSAGSYRDVLGLADYVRKLWEAEGRRHAAADSGDGAAARDRARGMVGLMFLLEATLTYQESTEGMHQLYKRGKELAAAAAGTGPSPSASSSSTAASAAAAPAAAGEGPSPSGSASAPATSPVSPSDAAAALPPDLVPLIASATHAAARATQALQTSRHHLSLRVLRTAFPATWDRAVHAELADSVLPAPGDPLGAARHLDPDDAARFAWPVELGMQHAAAHAAVYGRALVDEAARRSGKEWALSA